MSANPERSRKSKNQNDLKGRKWKKWQNSDGLDCHWIGVGMKDKSVKNNTRTQNLRHLFRCQLPEYGYAAAFRLTLVADKTEWVSFDLRHDLEPFKYIF